MHIKGNSGEILAFAGRIALAIVVVGLWSAPAQAQNGVPDDVQSEQELRQENQSLRARVAQLEAELEAALAQIDDLTSTNVALEDRLRELLRRQRPDQAIDQPPDDEPVPADEQEIEVTIDESIPNASPRALFNAVAESYRASMEEFGDITTADDRERLRAMRALHKWAASINRDLKSQIEWRVLPDDLAQLNDSRTLTVSAIDPRSGAILGDEFDVVLTDAQIARLHRALQRQPQEALVLRGVITPEIHINEARPTEGPFDNPRFIGPFAEFGFTIDVDSLMPPLPEVQRNGRLNEPPAANPPVNGTTPPAK